MISNTDSTLLVYSTEHMPVKVYKGRSVVEENSELKADKPLRIRRSELMKRRPERPAMGRQGRRSRAGDHGEQISLVTVEEAMTSDMPRPSLAAGPDKTLHFPLLFL